MRTIGGRSLAIAAATLMTLGLAGSASADAGDDARGAVPDQKAMRVIAQNDLGGNGNGGEGFGEVKTDDGRRILYVAHESGPICFSVVDVTKATDPVLLSQTDVPDENTRCNSLDVSGHLLTVANQVLEAGQPNAGLRIFDIEDPLAPREIGFFDTSGEYSRGVHYVWITDGRYAHISSGMPDFVPRRPGNDDQIYVIVDLLDPTKPKEAGRWWYPGTREGDQDPLPPPNEGFDEGCRLHNVDFDQATPSRAYLGYMDCGGVVLDIANKKSPRLVASMDDSPPEVGFLHTLWPVNGGRHLVATHESNLDSCEDYPKRNTIWSNRPSGLRQVSVIPLPENAAELCQRGGRFGAHNVFEHASDEPTFRSDDVIFTSFFNGGVRAYDISDPRNPREVAYNIPPAPEGSPAGSVQINDVYVDDRGLIFAVDRFAGGLYVMRSPVTQDR